MRILLATYCLILMLFSTIASAKIVFSLKNAGSDKDVKGVYVMDDNGMDITLLSDAGAIIVRWSPDGKQVMFCGSKRTEGNTGRYIFHINADGNNLRQITRLHEVSYDYYPFYFQRGKSILFLRYIKNISGGVLNVMDLESGEIRKIGELDFLPKNPDLSPNGKYIVYTEHVYNISRGVSNIWMMNADGSNRTQLLPPVTRVPGLVFNQLIIDRRHPRWNRHGDQIVYMERRYKFRAGNSLGQTKRSGLVFSALPYVCKFVTVDLGRPHDISNKEIFIQGNAYTDEVVSEVSNHAPFHLLIDDGSHHLEDQIFFFKHYVGLRNTISVMICEDIPKFHLDLLISNVIQTFDKKSNSYLKPELRCTNLWELDSYQLVLYNGD